MIDEKIYKEYICTNCANEKCEEKIKTENKLDIVIEQISTTTIMKCENFLCKDKRRNRNESKSDR